MWNLLTCDSEYNNGCKACSCEKRLFSKLVLACENVILDTIETSLVDKKVTCEKNICLSCTI